MLTATVTSTAGTPTGSMQFFDGTTLLTASAVNAQGIAAYTTSTLTSGTHSFSAQYAGDQNFGTATSNTVPYNISQDTQTITFPSLATPVTYGSAPLALKATASSGLAVSYAVTGPAMISGSTLTITGAGTALTSTGPAQGTVSSLSPDFGSGPSHSSTAETLICWMPGAFAAFGLFWWRKRLSAAARAALWMLLLAACGSALSACGGGNMHNAQATPPGSSSVTINAGASGASSQSLTLNLTITD